MKVVHKQLGIFFGKVLVKELNFHDHDSSVTGGYSSVKNRAIGMIDTHLAANGEKSSCMMFDTERLDWIFFKAFSFTVTIPSYWTCQLEQAFRERCVPSLPENTPSEENTIETLPAPLPSHCCRQRSEGVKKSSHSDRRRRRETST